MGKITGFMEFQRQKESYLPADSRVKNYKEFILPLKNIEAKTEGARCMDCGTPFCMTGCPVINIIPDWNHLVYTQNYPDLPLYTSDATDEQRVLQLAASGSK